MKNPNKTKVKAASHASKSNGFSYTRPFFEELVDQAITHAKKIGATDAGAEASEG
ncbi:MAG TPA: metalloprotease PmbA, partial [Burkholderiaceae bacterium]|nr:metalloprotease PmbA [Burkholderiaceae bacterium]